jgi:hypothetical protein
MKVRVTVYFDINYDNANTFESVKNQFSLMLDNVPTKVILREFINADVDDVPSITINKNLEELKDA